MYFMTRIIVNFLILTRFVYCDTMPEDLITDNDEQLAKLKRDDFVDSLRGQVPSTENQEKHEQKEESESTRHSSSTENDTCSISSLKSTFPLSSVFPSPSAFSFGNKDSITISTSKHVMLSLAPNSTTALENNTRNKLNYKTPALSNYSLVSRTTTSMAVEISKTFVENGKHNINHTQTKLYVAPSSLSFSTDIKSIISVLITSAPAAHSISSISDTAQSKLEPKRSVFNSGVVSNSIAVNEMSTTVSPQTGISGKTITPGDTSITSGISSKKMPVLPELHENGGFIPTAVKNEKGIGFIYVNVLLPIVAGITGALVITFIIMLFRCCRRRKLKKVRYFGAKRKRDFVHLDQINLLTDTSDDELD